MGIERVKNNFAWRKLQDRQTRHMARIFFANFTNPSDLEVFLAEAIHCHIQSAVQAKCRELARAHSLLLTAPYCEEQRTAFGFRSHSPNAIWILSKKGYVSGDTVLKQKLASMRVKITGQQPLTLFILQVCYEFTLIARLAPKWNRIGDWIVQGNDVFMTGKTQALKLNIVMSSQEITLTLNVNKLTFNLLKPDDLEISTGTLNRFKSDPSFTITENSICANQCYVLPNFTQAYIYSVSHTVPESTVFETYDMIRLHWKKQYGFILPESQHLFYQIFFKFNPTTFFSYPGCCVCRGKPLVIPSQNACTNNVATALVNDIHARMPSVCGTQLCFSQNILTPLTVLQPSHSFSSDVRCNTTPHLNKPLSQPLNKICSNHPSSTSTEPHIVPSCSVIECPNTATKNVSVLNSLQKQPDAHIPKSNTASKFEIPSITKQMSTSGPTKKLSLPRKRPNVEPLQQLPLPKRPVPPERDELEVPNTRSDNPLLMLSSVCKTKLEKAKIAVLKCWLKENGVRYQSKDKKEVLVKLAAQHIISTGKTFTM